VSAARYRVAPQPQGGWILGLRPGQLVGLLVAAFAGIVLLSLGGVLALGLVGVDLVVAVVVLVVPWHGHTLEQWAPLGLRFALGRAGGGASFRCAQPRLGLVTSMPEGGLEPREVVPAVSLPGELAELELLEGELERLGGVAFGVVHDRRAHTYTATLVCQSSAFYLLSDADRDARLAAYGAVLAALARDQTATRRIAWYERTLPPAADGLADYLHHARRPDVRMGDLELVSYLELLSGQGDGSEDHEVLVSIQLDAGRPAAGRMIRQQGGGEAGALVVLGEELRLLAERLSRAGVSVVGVLNRRGLAAAIRNGFDPFGRHHRERGQLPESAGGIGAHAIGPWARETGWGSVRADGSLHCTLWIAEWPRIDVRATFLEELLMHTGATRSVGLVMELLGPAQAMRRAERAATEAGAEQALRARIGKRTSARERNRESAVATREEELAVGHAAVRFAGYVTVSVPAESEDPQGTLEASVRKVEMAANSRQLRLERMWGQQQDALTFTLPLCRGLA
jgi:hypothetical protein